jgi:hypothetical protein
MIGGLWKSTGSAALLTAAGLYLGSAGMAPAQAADLGGDCCADLEERVAELEATAARKGNRKVSLTIAGQVATQLMYWSDGGSDRRVKSFGKTDNTEGTDPVGSDGSDLYIVDNTATLGGSGFNFSGTAKINPSLTAGFFLAIGLDSGARSAGSGPAFAAPTNNKGVSQIDDDGSGAPADSLVSLTYANWYLDHKQLGRLTVGRANTATAGVSTIDLGGAGVIANANISYWNGNMFLIADDTMLWAQWGSIMGGNPIAGSGLSRGNVISYSSPVFGGFSFAAAWGENDIWDAALRYAGEFSGFRVAAGVGYISNSTGFGDQVPDIPANDGFSQPGVWKGSASVLHVGTGLFLSGTYVERDHDNDRPNGTLWYLQGGISKNWTGLGNTVLYGEYAQVKDAVGACTVTDGSGNDVGALSNPTCDNAADFDLPDHFVIKTSEVNMWGIGIVQHIDAAAMELFLSYRHYEGEMSTLTTTVEFNNLDIVMGGARIRF